MTAIDTLRERVLARARDLGKSFPQIRMGVKFLGYYPEGSEEQASFYMAERRPGIYLDRGPGRAVLLDPSGIRETDLVTCFLVGHERPGPVLLPNFLRLSLLHSDDAWRRYGKAAMEQLRQWRSAVLANGRRPSWRIKLGQEVCPVCGTIGPAEEFWLGGRCPQKYCLDPEEWRKRKEG